MKQVMKRVLRAIFDDYQLNRIYCLDLPNEHARPVNPLSGGEVIREIASPQEFAAASEQRIRDHAWFLDDHALAYGIFENRELLCILCTWTHGNPGMPRTLPRLKADEAALVDLLTASRSRGKGHGSAIMRHAESDLFNRGYKKLWAWVWHSNRAPQRILAKLGGWRYSHFCVELKFKGMKDHLRFRLPPLGR